MDNRSIRERLNARAQRLLMRSRPAFGQIATWFLLALAILLACLPVSIGVGGRAGVPVSLISWIPYEVLSSGFTFGVVRAVLIISAVLWAAGRCLPWACWTAVASFTVMWSLRVETSAHVAHTFNLANMLLVVQALWYQFYWREILSAKRAGRFWSTPLYPYWVQLISIFYIGWFHTLAGLTKLTASGLDWGNGLSLQLWVFYFGWPASPAGQLILSHRWIAALAQTFSLVVETGAILCVFRRLRLLIGIALLGFYAGVLATFVNFGFHFNAIIVAWYLLPFDRWLDRVPVTEEITGNQLSDVRQ